MIFLKNIPQYTICNKKCTHVHISITKWYIMGFLQHVYHPIASEATLGRKLIIITLDSWVLHGSTAKNMVRHKTTWFDPLQPDFLATDESPPSLRSGFDCIIRPAPSGAGRTTPSQLWSLSPKQIIWNYWELIIYRQQREAQHTVDIFDGICFWWTKYKLCT